MASEGKEKVSVDDARQLVARREAVAVDVRSEEEWIAGHVPGAIHLPDADAEAGTKQPEEGARLMVIADDGKSAAKAAEKLSDQGYDAVAVDGGMDDWTSENFNVQPTEDPDEDTELGGELASSPIKDEESQ
jgi:thiosulfate sulfurtransferase